MNCEKESEQSIPNPDRRSFRAVGFKMLQNPKPAAEILSTSKLFHCNCTKELKTVKSLISCLQ